VEEVEEESKIVTTEQEREAYHIIRAILWTKVDISRIVERDTQSYFGVLLDDNNRKPICRLHLNGNTKYLGLFDKEKKEERILLHSIDDIYLYTDRLVETVLMYE